MSDELNFTLPDLSNPDNQGTAGTGRLPVGTYQVKIVEAKPGMKNGHGQYEITYQVVEPQEFVGRKQKDWLHITPGALPIFSSFLKTVLGEEAGSMDLRSVSPQALAQQVVGKYLEIVTEEQEYQGKTNVKVRYRNRSVLNETDAPGGMEMFSQSQQKGSSTGVM